jgi:hypothetical protein
VIIRWREWRAYRRHLAALLREEETAGHPRIAPARYRQLREQATSTGHPWTRKTAKAKSQMRGEGSGACLTGLPK